MEKINIAEILKDCPSGMELDCTIWDNVVFDHIDMKSDYPIYIEKMGGEKEYLTENGCFNFDLGAKCVIFPKGKTTWEGFQRPFKDGDIIFTHANCLKSGVGNTWISIYQEKRNGGVATYVDYAEDRSDYYSDLDGDKAFLCMEEDILRQRFATEKEKEKLFKAIKDRGYKWNPETKTLEKLIVPKFKVGDRIKHKLTGGIYKILFVLLNGYGGGVYSVAVTNEIGKDINIEEQDNYELVPSKFDITALEPFESRVLVRTSNHSKWVAAFYSHYDKEALLHHCVVGGLWYKQCIPYEGNEHLLDTTNACDEYFKTWK